MSFKVVQLTTKNGRKELAAVPTGWESNNKLQWPKKSISSQMKKLINDPSSVPENKKEWNEYNCTVKRINLKTLKEATEEVERMQVNSDTDSDLMPPPTSQKNDKRQMRRRIAIISKNADDSRNDFNDQVNNSALFRSCACQFHLT